MGAKTLIIKEWPPIMKVTGETIKAFFEVETTVTVKKKLDEKGIKYSDYVVTDSIIKAIEESEKGKPFVTYKAKSDSSHGL